MNSKVRYFFTCHCGCGQVSKDLIGKLDSETGSSNQRHYIKLPPNYHWAAKGCEGEHLVVKEFKGGNIIKKEEF